jgi:hypothetical protein
MSAGESESQMPLMCRGYPTADEAGPLDYSGPICLKRPRFGITGWTGLMYDPGGNAIGCVDDCQCGWIDLRDLVASAHPSIMRPTS